MADILAGDPRLRLLDGPDGATAAEVIVLVEQTVGDAAFFWLRDLRQKAPRDAPVRCVLVADHFHPSRALVAVGCGVMAVLSRRDLRAGRLGAAVVSVSQGAAHFSPALQGELLEQLDQLRREVLEPNGITMSGLSSRERDVLRGLADGLLTDEIAEQMGCSERTVKTLLYQLMSRYKLNTRSHAVAYAVRTGVA
ncbi:helix-turn-helix transcriptional regulator [Actinophytocola oryzae]|uniref:Regulatory LuxR family protein n=1 Tax=Actinophytocola oryzae TaxID=502181 RepID=A0A4R7VH39_9PSEU|nr:response regulator transcription factor [Actinophytocola oryzae]TDV48644.1 regulatory LuxR family protein [Actinophytocola oryzae]